MPKSVKEYIIKTTMTEIAGLSEANTIQLPSPDRIEPLKPTVEKLTNAFYLRSLLNEGKKAAAGMDQPFYLECLAKAQAKAGYAAEALQTIENNNDPDIHTEVEAAALVQEAKTSDNPRVNLQKAGRMIHLKKHPRKIGLLAELASEQAKLGFNTDAETTIGLKKPPYKIASFKNTTTGETYRLLEALSAIALARTKKGEDPRPIFSLAETLIAFGEVSPERRPGEYAKIARTQAQAGIDPSETIDITLKYINGNHNQSEELHLSNISAAKATAFIFNPNSKETLSKIWQLIEEKPLRAQQAPDHENRIRAKALINLAQFLHQSGVDSTSTFQRLETFCQNHHVSLAQDRDYILYLAETGHVKQAASLASTKNLEEARLFLHLLPEIAPILAKKSFTPKQIQELPPEIVERITPESNNWPAIQILSQNRPFMILRDHTKPAVEVSARAGQLSRVAANTDQERQEINTARKEIKEFALTQSEQHPSAWKAYVQSVVTLNDYGTASNELLLLLDHLQKDSSIIQPERYVMQVLKALIEIENPKGQTIATRLFTMENFNSRYREYFAKKLFEAEYWDPNLGKYLQEQITEESTKQPSLSQTQSEILRTLIEDFGLTPDLPSYQVLEKPGVLHSTTLANRVNELKKRIREFDGKSRDELIELFQTNPEALQIYYITKAGEYRYSVVNNYSQEKFATITKRIGELAVHEPTLQRFQDILKKIGLSEEEAASIITDARAGKPLIISPTRVFSFSSLVEYGSSYEQALERLQNVWLEELPSLIFAKARKLQPQTMADSLQTLEESRKNTYPAELNRLLERLKTTGTKISPQDISAIAKDLRNNLIQKYKQTKDKESQQMVHRASEEDLIKHFVRNHLPDSPATDEWENHLRETFVALQEAQAKQQKETKTTEKTLELTFLDKNEAFVRALRFADDAQCCFNAGDTNFKARTYEYVTRLNKDPLSFMMDLKAEGSNNIMGFIFGRTGVNPQTGKPVIMLNGIYSQMKGPTLNENILKIIEEQMGGRLHADTIVIASQHGGKIEQPKGYEKSEIELEAIRALQNTEDQPEKKVYDDIGNVANGKFKFSGYIKRL